MAAGCAAVDTDMEDVAQRARLCADLVRQRRLVGRYQAVVVDVVPEVAIEDVVPESVVHDVQPEAVAGDVAPPAVEAVVEDAAIPEVAVIEDVAPESAPCVSSEAASKTTEIQLMPTYREINATWLKRVVGYSAVSLMLGAGMTYGLMQQSAVGTQDRFQSLEARLAALERPSESNASIAPIPPVAPTGLAVAAVATPAAVAASSPSVTAAPAPLAVLVAPKSVAPVVAPVQLALAPPMQPVPVPDQKSEAATKSVPAKSNGIYEAALAVVEKPVAAPVVPVGSDTKPDSKPVVSPAPAAQGRESREGRVVSVPADGVVLVQAGSSIRPVQVGERLPNGEVLVKADSNTGQIESRK